MNVKWNSARRYVDKARAEMRQYKGMWRRAVEHWRGGRRKESLKMLGAALVVAVLGIACFQVLLVPVVGLGVVVGFVVVLLGPPLWVFIDATHREVRRPFHWAVFALLAPIIGAVVYLLARPEAVAQVACTQCQKPVRQDYSACPFCGAAAAVVPRSCPSCHSVLESEWAFCPYCRLDLHQAETSGLHSADAAAAEERTSFCRDCG